MFSNKSIKFRLYFGFFIVSALFMMTLIYVSRNEMILADLQNEGAEKFKQSAELDTVNSHIEAVYAVIGDSVINHKLDETRKDLQGLLLTKEADIKTLEKLADTEAERELVKKTSALYNKYLEKFEKEFLPEIADTEQLSPKARQIDGEMDELREGAIGFVTDFQKILYQDAVKSDESFDATATESIRWSVIGLILSLLVSVFFAVSFSNSLNETLSSVTRMVSDLANRLLTSASHLAGATHQLSEANVKQAAALQQTSATMEQMSAMIQKSSSNAEMSSTQAHQSTEYAQRGEEASLKMIESISEIKSSHERISEQVEQSNKKIGQITEVIKDIGAKTKVINEIVFQTKLLSFNASVEAARAGEHGKGFAVVAAEIGSLAQMSGNAAREITDLLDSSIETVNKAVSESKDRIGEIVNQGEGVVANGETVARETGAQLQEITRSIGVVNENSVAIAQASREQAQGVLQISEALSQLDKATHQNATVAKQVSVSADEVSDYSKQLNESMEALSALVHGRAA